LSRDIDRFSSALSEAVGSSKVVLDPERFADYAKDESDSGRHLPDVLLFAESTSDVQAALRLCSAHGVPVTPCGARTGKSGGSVPIEGGLALSLERMKRIKEISVGDLVCVCEPGVVTGELMKAVEEKGLFYPPDPNSLETCTIGGNLAENSGGPRALKYGVTRDYVLGLEVVLPSGEALRVGHRSIKGVAGYDLTALFVGSEGTLGVITEATLQLLPKPREVMTALLVFDSLRGAAEAVSAMLASGILPRTLELMDSTAISAVDGKGFNFPAGTQAALILELDGDTLDPLFEQASRAEEICQPFGLKETLVAQNESERRGLWEARPQVSTALRTLKPLKVSDDIAVPRSRIAETIERIHEIGKRHGILVATYGHAGDGNLHANFLYGAPEERARVDLAVREMLEHTIALGGTITGEHGVGLAKRSLLPLEQGPGLIALQKSLKHLFDPQGILNPGKIFE
jgi:glycolate oxidase